MLKLIPILLLLSINVMASTIPLINKSQICAMYEESFIVSADLYEDTKSCLDLNYSVLSFKQMLLTKCQIDPEYVKVVWYLDKQLKQKCDK